MDYSNLKSSVASVIKTNGNEEITGQVMQDTLLSIINNMGAGRTFSGVATPSTRPGTPDGNVFYLAFEAGLYANFGGVILQDGQVGVITNTHTGWALTAANVGIQGGVPLVDVTELDTPATDGDRRGETPQYRMLVRDKGTENQLNTGALIVYSDSLGHVVTQELYTHYTLNEDGTLNTASHDHTTIFHYFRSYTTEEWSGNPTGWSAWADKTAQVDIADGSITTAKLAGNAVTVAKLATNAVSRTKIQPLAVDSSKLAENAVTTEKIADESVTGEKIGVGVIGYDRLSGQLPRPVFFGNYASYADAMAAAALPAQSGNDSFALLKFTISAALKSGLIVQQVGDRRTVQMILWDGSVRIRHIWFTDTTRTAISRVDNEYRTCAVRAEYASDTLRFYDVADEVIYSVYIPAGGGSYELPTASTGTLGGVKVSGSSSEQSPAGAYGVVNIGNGLIYVPMATLTPGTFHNGVVSAEERGNAAAAYPTQGSGAVKETGGTTGGTEINSDTLCFHYHPHDEKDIVVTQLINYSPTACAVRYGLIDRESTDLSAFEQMGDANMAGAGSLNVNIDVPYDKTLAFVVTAAEGIFYRNGVGSRYIYDGQTKSARVGQLSVGYKYRTVSLAERVDGTGQPFTVTDNAGVVTVSPSAESMAECIRSGRPVRLTYNGAACGVLGASEEVPYISIFFTASDDTEGRPSVRKLYIDTETGDSEVAVLGTLDDLPLRIDVTQTGTAVTLSKTADELFAATEAHVPLSVYFNNCQASVISANLARSGANVVGGIRFICATSRSTAPFIYNLRFTAGGVQLQTVGIIGNASTSNAGLLSTADKAKLDALYTAVLTVAGGVAAGDDGTVDSNELAELMNHGNAVIIIRDASRSPSVSYFVTTETHTEDLSQYDLAFMAGGQERVMTINSNNETYTIA